MTSPKSAMIAAILGVLLGLTVTATPAFADGNPDSGTLTWSSPLTR